ncbi:hypothetical protein PoB_004936900 [Plakobranchus ocellatus]|uniref:RRP15-like protein n=1 Tax=Plakobranchus ocellatus TaxID=259542 RepID=A0AAV4BRS4_9GAST|nr:hypothetical protein PoB_004936900 [Plakobranchus ocellatus]
MADAAWKRAPNATFGFVGGKLKAKCNKTLEWLLAKTVEEQKKLLLFSVSDGYKLRKAAAEKNAATDTEIRSRQVEKVRIKDSKRRAAVTKSVKQALKNLNKSADCFTTLSAEQRSFVDSLWENPDSQTGRLFHHTWEQEGADKTWMARNVSSDQVKDRGLNNTEHFILGH